MAFQLIDDVLDFTARESVLGKPVGGDLREGKVTLPLIYALKDCGPDERQLVATVLAERSYTRVPFRSMLDLVERHAGVERARERAETFASRARVIIGEFPESPYQRALAAVADLVTDRDR
jgi:octaprenyl-diphosphate synthase